MEIDLIGLLPIIANKIIDAFTILHGIESKLSAAYNPRTNGLVERRNKNISKALKKFIKGAYGRWDDWW